MKSIKSCCFKGEILLLYFALIYYVKVEEPGIQSEIITQWQGLSIICPKRSSKSFGSD